MTVNIICEYWDTKHTERQAELDYCIFTNLHLPFARVMLATLPGVVTPTWACCEAEQATIQDRSYATLFNLASERFPGQICCICNTDIYFKPELEAQLQAYDWDHQALALSRWDVVDMAKPEVPFRTGGSYDAYFFKAPMLIPEATFTPGVLGCDSALAHLLAQQRKTLNPADTIHACHLHITNVRSYDGGFRLNLPYNVIVATR